MTIGIDILVPTNKNSGGSYDDTDIRQQLNDLKAIVNGIAAQQRTFREYQAGYASRSDFIGTFANGSLVKVKFPKPFSERPFVKVTLDITDASPRIIYVANVTAEGFEVATNYASSLIGVWYEAHLID